MEADKVETIMATVAAAVGDTTAAEAEVVQA
jgi:hypothetical protein